MTFSFKIWDQGNAGDPMAIRVDGVAELRRLARLLTGPDAALNWPSLGDYLAYSATATGLPTPFVRRIDVLWESAAPRVPTPYCQDRMFRVTYTGRLRARGGYASQGYCYLDPAWAHDLQPFRHGGLVVDVFPGADRDLFVVR